MPVCNPSVVYMRRDGASVHGHEQQKGVFSPVLSGVTAGTDGWGRSENHKIRNKTEWFGLEGAKDHPVPTIGCHRSSLPLEQVNQIPVQPGLEFLQEWGAPSLPGQPQLSELPAGITSVGSGILHWSHISGTAFLCLTLLFTLIVNF